MSDFNKIAYKKPLFPVEAHLTEYLTRYSRKIDLPFTYEDLTRFSESVPIFDANGKETLWYSVLYYQSEMEAIKEDLIRGYQLLVGSGKRTAHLGIEDIQYCSFGNTKPFRIKVVNQINENHDYYYVKRADASRIYGLELEELFSPNKVSFLVDKDTLVEEHVIGIPCDDFIAKYEHVQIENRLRFSKEFVKFNERCFARLLGDMRAYNFVVEITQDFDNIQYRLRAIDFDQQTYEGRKSIYMPQYYKENIKLVELAQELLSAEVAAQYQREERVAISKRFASNKRRVISLLDTMRKDQISTAKNIQILGQDLARHHQDKSFISLSNMADILRRHLQLQLQRKN
ncbi:MAG: hypothetical protein RI842_10825 [Schleiferiaceae bacterium]|nr:hypothetical protein [Schleiferiaceae bacterium]